MILVQIEILELTTCSATGTGMLVKRALISNETKVLKQVGFLWNRTVVVVFCSREHQLASRFIQQNEKYTQKD